MSRFQYVGPVEGEVVAYGGVQTENRVFDCPPEFEEKAKANPEFQMVDDDFEPAPVDAEPTVEEPPVEEESEEDGDSDTD